MFIIIIITNCTRVEKIKTSANRKDRGMEKTKTCLLSTYTVTINESISSRLSIDFVENPRISQCSINHQNPFKNQKTIKMKSHYVFLLFYFQLNGKFFSKRRKKRKELIFWFLLKE
jgi:hypothetical protein